MSRLQIVRAQVALLEVLGVYLSIIVDIVPRRHELRDQIGSHDLTVLSDFGSIRR